MQEPKAQSRPDHYRSLAPWEVNAVIDYFMYHMGLERRGELMQLIPSVYNRLIGRTIMATRNLALD